MDIKNPELMLYTFKKLEKKLDQLGFPRIDANKGFQIIKGIDFEKAFKSGSISFKTDGIYLEYEGREYRGYMFIKEPYISQYGKYPKFHLTRCKTIRDFINSGQFRIRYEFSNARVNDLIDKQTREVYKDQVLDYCGNCSRELFESIQNTNDFHDTLDKSDIPDEITQVDIFGYVKNKERISKAHRESVNYTCDSCGVSPKSRFDKRYWHTHHIDGDKTNNNPSNLRCLCIKCHSEIDATHKRNFSKKNMQLEIDTFTSKYFSDS
jgi:hypothetical protein